MSDQKTDQKVSRDIRPIEPLELRSSVNCSARCVFSLYFGISAAAFLILWATDHEQSTTFYVFGWSWQIPTWIAALSMGAVAILFGCRAPWRFRIWDLLVATTLTSIALALYVSGK